MKSIAQFWDSAIVPTLVDYIRIPAKSPHFDKDWAKNGHIEAAVTLAADWCRKHPVEGMRLEIVRLPDRTPVLFIEVPATKGAEKAGTVLLYGHLDKQPEMTGWAEGTGPWIPVIRDGRLYGRGGADDGYAIFAAICALKELKESKRPHARTVILIECCEESGSTDLPAYLEFLSSKIQKPSLVVGLDSGCGNYEQLWGTTSLRIPPTVNGEKAAAKLKEILEADPPYGARVRFEAGQAATGWHAPATAPWLERILDETSKKHFGKPAMWLGEGGTIPFMAMLGEKFPAAQFLITGVLGPHSNAHGPNEFLDIGYAKKLTAAVADVLAAQASQD